MIGGGDVYDVHRLRILREVRLRGTLAAVASALGYSPSAISHQLSILELETGATLLESVGRGVRLTPTALALVTHAENVLRELVRAEATVAAHRTDVVGTVRVATFQTAAWALVPAAVRSLAERHPGSNSPSLTSRRRPRSRACSPATSTSHSPSASRGRFHCDTTA